MTPRLQEALSHLAKLSAPEQDAVATIVMDEIASEQRWSESFAKSQGALAALADGALAEHASSKTRTF